MQHRLSESPNVMMIDLDMKERPDEEHPQPKGELEVIQLKDSLEKTTKINSGFYSP